ncbi:GNAT family N-acetyltransferase [Mucilaginibacter pallidiroseus]|uniref:GNAT family N-acetyltransferase n=1 Tax=Mucilaginibacter pallidiroseus TaxID=2599295 RepID=A0A563UIJ6_9SPHI|nr:GNAT family N-acetyltransferase [Mucilaginibacter pallidiroseus]TWR31185.1 GNAT family N-acetyltransferase [Mucilaginibacter pallidiroseus]
MDFKVDIVKLKVQDADKLLQLSKRTFFDAFAHQNSDDDMAAFAAQAYTLERITQELNNLKSAFYFILVDGEIAGYLKLNQGDAKTEFKDEYSLEVERIYILQDFQGKQLRKHLIEFAVNSAKDKGFDSIWLGVWEHNHGAIRFYERNGFTVFSSHKFMLGSDEQTDLLMRKNI